MPRNPEFVISIVFDLLKGQIENYVSPTDAEWDDFLPLWQPFSFEKGIMVTKIGQVERYFYFINDGLIRGFFVKNGEEYNIGFSYQGDPSGVYDSFHHQCPSEWALETLMPTTGLRITHGALMKAFDEFKVFERWGRLFFTDASIGLGVFIRSLVADTAEEKFQKLMKRSPHVIQMIPQKHLASYLGMTPETFSRMRKKWMS